MLFNKIKYFLSSLLFWKSPRWKFLNSERYSLIYHYHYIMDDLKYWVYPEKREIEMKRAFDCYKRAMEIEEEMRKLK